MRAKRCFGEPSGISEVGARNLHGFADPLVAIRPSSALPNKTLASRILEHLREAARANGPAFAIAFHDREAELGKNGIVEEATNAAMALREPRRMRMLIGRSDTQQGATVSASIRDVSERKRLEAVSELDAGLLDIIG